MKPTIFAAFLLLATFLFAQAQENMPEFNLLESELEAQLRFLASDELQGRRTGELGNNIAARYLATYYEAHGLKKAPGLENYYQAIPFVAVTPPSEGMLDLNGESYMHGEDFLIMNGPAAELNAKAVFAGHGWIDEATGHDDYKKIDVEGKIVITLPGPPDAKDPLAVFQAMKTKRKIAAEKGAIALIELYRLSFPWSFFRSYFNKESLRIDEGEDGGSKIVYAWLKEKETAALKELENGKKLKSIIKSSGYSKRPVQSQNVLGIIEGTDPELKEEYVLLTAHYDHVGTGKNGGGPFSPQDSIFNGARDNAMGTVALLAATKALSQSPPKRSILVMAVTGEELGLLGSQYYADHPIIPLQKIVYNLNTDGAGYNSTEHLSAIGFGRTGIDELINQSAEKTGLKVFPNPAPEQNLFDRSDNVSFAAKGIPAISISPGVTGFDQTIMKYYHQVGDEADSIDYTYLLKYCQSFAHAARLVADRKERPAWAPGDKYEEAGRKLYEQKP